MKRLKNFISTLSENTTMTKREYLLTATTCAFAGIVIGMLCSPRKNMKISSDNGNSFDSKDFDEDSYDDSWEYDLDDWGE